MRKIAPHSSENGSPNTVWELLPLLGTGNTADWEQIKVSETYLLTNFKTFQDLEISTPDSGTSHLSLFVPMNKDAYDWDKSRCQKLIFLCQNA
jgi:hypothetical protein